MAKIRIFTENADLTIGDSIVLDERQSHYLSNVMKQSIGSHILCFNGKDGEFEAEITKLSKKAVELSIKSKKKEFSASSDIWLLFAPVKKDRTDFIIEKSTELGVSKIIPVITRHTISAKTKTERFISQSIEAAEQSRRLDVPVITDAIKLKDLLKSWDKNRILYFMDESGEGEVVLKAFGNKSGSAAILVGPEGGFAEEELDFLRKLPYTKSVGLGSLILRAETAAVAALSCWQAVSGGWK
jgi:16S rRNA (uracil1498-N3)-methyltransferase